MPASAQPVPSRTASSTSSRLSDSLRAEAARLKPYVIVSDIGKGSFATVYKGYHEVTVVPDLLVTLKTFMSLTALSLAGD